MKKVYVVTDGEKAFIACKSKEDAEDLVKMWGKHWAYNVVEIPYIDIQEGSVIPSYPTYKNKSTDVEPMPFIGKPAIVNKGIEPTPVVTCSEKNTFFSKVPMDEVGMI